MTNRQYDTPSEMQRTTVNQARTAFEQAFELQRDATEMALNVLEMQDTAGRQGLEFTKAVMQNYLQGIESIVPEMRRAMQEGMEAGMAPARTGSPDREVGERQGGPAPRSQPYEQPLPGRQSRREMEPQRGQQETGRRPQRAARQERGAGQRARQAGDFGDYSGSRTEPGGHGEAGRWIPQEETRYRSHPSPREGEEFEPRSAPGRDREPSGRRTGGSQYGRYDRGVEEAPPRYGERTEPPYRRPRGERSGRREDVRRREIGGEKRQAERQSTAGERSNVNIPGGETAEMEGQPADFETERERADVESPDADSVDGDEGEERPESE